MRINSAADSLLATLDSTASQDESSDKGLFARLLKDQPETGQHLPDVQPDKATSAKASARQGAGEAADGTQTPSPIAPAVVKASALEAAAVKITPALDTASAMDADSSMRATLALSSSPAVTAASVMETASTAKPAPTTSATLAPKVAFDAEAAPVGDKSSHLEIAATATTAPAVAASSAEEAVGNLKAAPVIPPTQIQTAAKSDTVQATRSARSPIVLAAGPTPLIDVDEPSVPGSASVMPQVQTPIAGAAAQPLIAIGKPADGNSTMTVELPASITKTDVPAPDAAIKSPASELIPTPSLATLRIDTRLTQDSERPDTGPAAATAPVTAGDARVLLATRLVQASKPAASLAATPAPVQQNPLPAFAPRPLMASTQLAGTVQEAKSDNVDAVQQKPLADLSEKATSKPKQVRNTHAAAASKSVQSEADTAASMQVNNAAAVPLTSETMHAAALTSPTPSQEEAANSDTMAYTSVSKTTAQASANNAPSVLAATAAPAPTDSLPDMQRLQDSAFASEQAMQSSADPSLVRGSRLPHSGKDLPPTKDDTASAADTNQSSSQHLFRELADAGLSSNAAPTPDSTVLQANQTLINASAANSNTTDTLAQQPNNTGNTTLTSSAITAGSPATPGNSVVPYVMTSSLAMQSGGWSEEAVHHIRWLKDHDQQSAEIQLHPAELGRMSISIDIKDGQASVQLLAGSAEAKDLLEKSLPELRNLLAQSGMSLADSGVTQHKGGQQAWPSRFNPSWFESDESKPLELSAGKPALFRSAGGSNRIDQYV